MFCCTWQLSTTYVLLYKEVEQIASAEDSTMAWQLSRRTICRKKKLKSEQAPKTRPWFGNCQRLMVCCTCGLKNSERRRLDHGLAIVNDLCVAVQGRAPKTRPRLGSRHAFTKPSRTHCLISCYTLIPSSKCLLINTINTNTHHCPALNRNTGSLISSFLVPH